jgi:ABC-type glycerol-3-phosphate transport system substrate-binding protein
MFQTIFKKLPPDKVLFAAALAAVVVAFIVVPKEAIRIKRTELSLALNAPDSIPRTEIEALISEFEAQNQGITVSIAAEEPDIVIFNPLFLPEPGGQRHIIDETLLSASINPLFYNVLLLQSIGFDRPPKTQDDFLAICRKMKGAKNQFAYSFSENIFISILPWFYGAVPQNDNAEGLAAPDWTARASIGTFAFLKLLHEEQLIDGDSLDKSDEELLGDFLGGKTAMMTGPSTLIKKIEKSKPGLVFNVTTIPSPAGYRGRPLFNVSVLRIGIVETSEKKDEAALFTAFMKEKQNEIASLLGAIPGTLNETLERGDDHRNAGPVLGKTRDLYEGSIVIDESGIFQEPRLFESIFKEELKKMWAGNQTPAECAAAVQARIKAGA